MAGSYPNSPEKKFAYDEDGSIMWKINSVPASWPAVEASTITLAGSTNLTDINDTAPQTTTFWNQGTNDGAMAVCIYFPEQRTIEGLYWYQTKNIRNSFPHSIAEIEYSSDTTNGIDGTWTNGLATLSDSNGDVIGVYSGISVSNSYRSQINAVNWSNVRAIRWFSAGGGDLLPPAIILSNFHVYGTIPLTQSPDRLIAIDNDTGLEYDMNQDWGDVPRGVTLDKEIKLRNNSSTLDASNITITFEDINPAPGGTSNTWHTIKEAGGAFGASLSYTGSILAGADSNLITVRLTIADDEDISLQEARMQINVATWT